MDEKIKTLQQWIDASRAIVFFGGAGVSTESGIPDFRSVDGLYSQKYAWPPEQILSRSFFDAQPEEFYRFYRDKMLCLDAQPNAAHKKLAELEAAGRLRSVVTQNIDGLHQLAGSKRVWELHGSVHRNYCMKCRRPYGVTEIKEGTGVPRCVCGGTSLAVYPAAGLINYYRGSRLVLINKSPTPCDGRASLAINLPIGEVLGQITVR